MPDWKKEIRERMPELGLPSDAKKEVFSELASHLEENYEAARATGITETKALETTLQEIEDWSVLASEIEGLKLEDKPMNQRTKCFWLPATATLLGASALLMLLQFLRVQPHLVWLGHVPIVFYWPWIASLPVFGAIGSYLSKRAHSPVRIRVAAALAPALALFGTMCLILPVDFVMNGFSAMTLVYFAAMVTNWAVIPALGLSLGTLPFVGAQEDPLHTPSVQAC